MQQQEIITGVIPFILGQNWVISSKTRYLYGLFEYEHKIDSDALIKTIRYMQLRHDILRARVVREANGWRQVIPYPDQSVSLTRVVLEGSSRQEHSAIITQTATSLYQELDRFEGPFVRFVHFERIDDDKDILLVIMHHLIFDYYSKKIFVDDFGAIYQSMLTGQMHHMSPKPPSFKQFVEEIIQFAHVHLIHEFERYWSQLLWDEMKAIPADYSEEHILAAEATWAHIQFFWTPEETGELLRAIRSTRLPIFDVLIAVLSHTIAQWTGAPFAHIMAMDSGRFLFSSMLNIDVSRTIGFLAVNRRIFLDLRNTLSMNDVVQTVHKQLKNIPHKGIGSDILRGCLPEEYIRDFFAIHVADKEHIFFNFLGVIRKDSSSENSPWKPSEEYRDVNLSAWESPILIEPPANKTPFRRYRPFSYEGAIVNGQLRFRVNFDSSIYKQNTVERFCHDFEKNLKEFVLNHPT